MNTKALNILEFNKIKDMLFAHATSDMGRELCKKLLPSSNIKEVEVSLCETTDACTRIRFKGSISFGSAYDISSSISRLKAAAPLSIPELLHISSMLNNCHMAISYGKHDNPDVLPDLLDVYFSELDYLPTIYKELSRCILSEDTLADDASPELFSIRRQKHTLESRMHTELQRILNAHREYLMDSVIAMRDGAYCLPIKSEYKNKVPGVVHDMSSTGSTVFIEPMAVINLNNSLKQLELSETREISVILANLSSMLLPYTDILLTDTNILSHLDFVFAKAKLSRQMEAAAPKMNDNGYINIKDGRHPLLDKTTAVPISITLGDAFDLLIITGPNTGGKTVSLKTIGLFTLMAQSGLHIPAFDGSELSVFDEVYADIGDEQSIEQSLSTFSGHMTHIVDILKHVDKNSLCLFDELCAGTDPTEGAALAISILSYLHSMGIRTVATTHYSELKVYALTTPNVENASCEFDVETLRPTYRILLGIPGKSNAFAISKKLGLPEHIIDTAKTHIEKEDADLEDLLARLDSDRALIEKERLEISSYKKQLEELKAHYKKQDESLDRQKNRILEDAKKEASEILSRAKETADSTIRNINKLANGAGLGKALEEQRDKLRNSLKDVTPSSNILSKRVTASPSKKPLKLSLGDEVKVLSMNLRGTVSSLPNDKGQLYVQMGILRSQVNINDVELIDDKKANPYSKKSGSSGGSFMKAAAISPEINLIGYNIDDACSALDKYLDDALLSHLNTVRIIHGRGTGALKKGIHSYLKSLSFVKSFSLADFDDGGDAVTVVTLR